MTAIAEPEVRTASDPLAQKNPFKFLESYGENDEAVFAGRGEDLTQILAYFALEPTYVLYGRSGLGKTSIIRAGLFPRLERAGYLPIYVRILDDPEKDLCEAVAEKLGIDRPMPYALAAILANVPPRAGSETVVTPIVLVLDQFEEFFIRFRKDEALVKRKRFAELLAAISVAGGAAVRIIFSLREDHVAELEELRAQFSTILNRSHRLLPLTAVGTREAILATLDHNAVAYDLAVPGEIVTIVEKRGFNPLELQIYCSEVFEAARVRAREEQLPIISLDPADLRKVGSIEQVYEKYLDAVTRDMPPDRALLACCVLDVLRTAEDTKRAIRVSDIAIDGESDPEVPVSFCVTSKLAFETLTFLCDKHVVRQLPTREGWYELLHDGIVPVLTKWLLRNEGFRLFRDADRLVDYLRAIGDYLTEKQIRYRVDKYRDLLRLSPEKVAFIFKSAVYDCADSVAYWARRNDEVTAPGSDAVLLEAIDDPEHAVAALRATAKIASPALASACFRKAILDPHREVRRSAGTAYASIGNIDFGALNEALRRSRTRRNAIDLVADLQMQERDIRRVGRLSRWRANRVVKKRRLDRGAELIRNRETIGVFGGLLAAAVWIGVAEVPILYFVTSIKDPSSVFSDAAFVAIVIGLAAVILGMWGGRRVVGRAARESVLERRELWSDRALMPPEFLAIWIGIALIVKSFVFDSVLSASASRWYVQVLVGAAVLGVTVATATRTVKRLGERASPRRWRVVLLAVVVLLVVAGSIVSYLFDYDAPIVAIAAVLIVSALLGPGARMVQRSLDLPYVGFTKILVRAVEAGYVVGTIPLILLLLSMTPPASAGWRHVFGDALAVGVAVSIVMTFQIPFDAFALAWAQKLYPLSAEEIVTDDRMRIASPWLRGGLTASIPLFLSFIAVVFGTDCVPLLSALHRYAPNESIRRTFPSMWPDTHYIRIAPQEGVAVGTIKRTAGDANIFAEDARSTTRSMFDGRFAISKQSPLRLGIQRKGTSTVVSVAFVKESFTDPNDLGRSDHDVLTFLPVECKGGLLVIDNIPERKFTFPHAIVIGDVLYPVSRQYAGSGYVEGVSGPAQVPTGPLPDIRELQVAPENALCHSTFPTDALALVTVGNPTP